ncbi:MAG: M50 family metallopeptidase [Christensenellaceae bacterium]
MGTVLTIIIGLLMLTILVVIHEGGHFFVGRACGMRIDEFSVGFGPKLFSREKKGILYSVRALPLGGFVQFYGEDEEVDAAYEPRAFNNRPIWQRALTLVAGSLMNIITALIITIFVLTIFGDYVPTVHEVSPDMPAAEVGIEVGDRIVSFNGKKIDFSMEFEQAVAKGFAAQDDVEVTVLRDGKAIDFTVPLQEDAETGTKKMGIKYDVSARNKFGFFEAIGLSFKWMYLIIVEMFQVLGALIFKGQGLDGLAGPVGTISLIGQAVRSGPEITLRIAALLSINLGIMNILPFPALDGGRLLFLGIEKLRGKPLPRDKEGYINLAGLVLLFALMIFLTYQDIARLFIK